MANRQGWPHNRQARSPSGSSDDRELQTIPITQVPIEYISIYNLVFASAACLGEYLDKLYAVEYEMKAAHEAGIQFSQKQLQQILDDTARFGEGLLCKELGERCQLYGPFVIDWKAVDFQQKVVTMLLDFPNGPNGEGPQLNRVAERTFAEALELLQYHTKCIKILQLLHQLKRKEKWTVRALASLAGELCLCPTKHLPSRFEDLVAVYGVALSTLDMSPEDARRFIDKMPDQVQYYAGLFDRQRTREPL
ncbi:hypothetical protein ACSSS7_001119 [Eimeria intestinalis]